MWFCDFFLDQECQKLIYVDVLLNRSLVLSIIFTFLFAYYSFAFISLINSVTDYIKIYRDSVLSKAQL